MTYKVPYTGKPRTREEWRDLAVKSHLCTACLAAHPEIWKVCPSCQAPEANREYMPSNAELRRACGLIHMQRAGKISRLTFHPRYDLKVNGIKVCTYEADAEYLKDGKTVVEDTKAQGTDFMEDTAKLKISLFNAVYAKLGVKVTIYRG